MLCHEPATSILFAIAGVVLLLYVGIRRRFTR